MTNRVFCDTSFFFASLVNIDSNHDSALQKLEQLTREKFILHTTWDIISETITLLRYRGSSKVALSFLDDVVPELDIIEYDASVREVAIKLFKKLAKDMRISFCDCISFVVNNEVLQLVPVCTFDKDFKKLGSIVF